MSFGARVATAGLVVLAACGGDIRLTSGDAGGALGADQAIGEARAGCTGDDGCNGVGGHCDTVTQQCVACIVDAHCGATGLRRCDVALHRCVACGVASDCQDGQTCEPTTRQCVPSCAFGNACPASTKCNAARGICVACTAAAECKDDNKTCDVQSGRCVECLDDASCAGDKHRCDTVSGRCVECLVSADCRNGGAGKGPLVCDPSRLECSTWSGSH